MTEPERSLAGLGQRPVDVPVTCVITRFGLRGAHHLLPTWRSYHDVTRETRRSGTPGLLRSAFLVEDPKTCYSLSLWRDPAAIPWFGTNVPAHVDAARQVFGRLAFDPETGPELWSTRWRLVAVSNNLRWNGFDLGAAISGE
jgi:hypothetical protein